MSAQPMYIWNALAISGTDTYKSLVFAPTADEAISVQEFTTSTATGTLSLEGNYLPDKAYEDAVSAAAGATREAREAANTTGWQQVDLDPSATITVTAAMKNTIILEQPLPRRMRFSYTNATNSGAITATIRFARP